MMGEELCRFLNRHIHDIANRFVVVEDFQGLRVVTCSAAVFTRHVGAREEIHLQLDHALSFAGFAASAFGVKRKSAAGITAHP